MRTLYVGDVHGCSRELAELLRSFNFKMGKDQLYFTGDVIDKGPHNLHVLEIIRDYNGISVMGNHEENFMEMYEARDDYDKFKDLVLQYTKIETDNPKKAFLDRFNIKDFSQAKKIYDTVRKFPYFLHTSHGFLVHAGVNPHLKNIDKTNKALLTHIRRTTDGNPWFTSYKGIERVIFGHWAAQNYYEQENAICLDTGCYHGFYLTGWCPEENKFYQVKSKHKNNWPLGKDRKFKDMTDIFKDKDNVKKARELGLSI